MSSATIEQPVSDVPDENESHCFALPTYVIASLNITDQVRALPESMLLASPFADEAVFESVLNNIFRTLCRRQMRHVLLVGERGVGATSLLGEMAVRMVRGEPSQLQDMQVVLADARH